MLGLKSGFKDTDTRNIYNSHDKISSVKAAQRQTER